jgi:hypothetical protein
MGGKEDVMESPVHALHAHSPLRERISTISKPRLMDRFGPAG